jgi:hypothetical protein
VEREGALGVGVGVGFGTKLESLKRICESLEETTKGSILLANHWRFIKIGMPNVYSC